MPPENSKRRKLHQAKKCGRKKRRSASDARRGEALEASKSKLGTSWARGGAVKTDAMEYN